MGENEITFEAIPENIPALTDFINEGLEAIDCPVKSQIQIDVALDEIVSNVCFYAYAPGTGPITVRLEALGDPAGAAITFTDSGTPYDPLKNEDPVLSLPVEERAVGGLGIYLVKRTMDDVRYEYSSGKNILRIVKYF